MKHLFVRLIAIILISHNALFGCHLIKRVNSHIINVIGRHSILSGITYRAQSLFAAKFHFDKSNYGHNDQWQNFSYNQAFIDTRISLFALWPIVNKLKQEQDNFPLPTLQELKNKLYCMPETPSNAEKSVIDAQHFISALDASAAIIKNQHAQVSNWSRKENLPQEVYDLQTKEINEQASFYPYAQKIIVPAGSEVALFGDIHGSVQSLIGSLTQLEKMGYIDQNFKIINNTFYCGFLGDYVDRGMYGTEVLYILMRLKIANPDRVFMVRGNHEEINLNAQYGFCKELEKKFPNKTDSTKIKTMIANFYTLLPVVVYLGCHDEKNSVTNFIHCCHGGLELGFDPSTFLANSSVQFKRINQLERHKNSLLLSKDKQALLNNKLPSEELMDFSPKSPHNLGFLWNDFIDPEHSNEELAYTPGRGWAYGKQLTQDLLSWSTGNAKLNGIIRAHQHNHSMFPGLWDDKGAHPIWDGMVYTLFSGVANFGIDKSNKYAFPYDTFCMLGTASAYADWSLTHWHRELVALSGSDEKGRTTRKAHNWANNRVSLFNANPKKQL